MPEKMTVGLDGTPLSGPVGGIRRFTDQLLVALREEYAQDNFVALSDQIAPGPRGLEKRWWLYGLNRAIVRAGAGIFHGTDFAVPYVPTRPSVMTVHDLSPWKTPNAASERIRLRCAMLMRLRVPKFVHTPSESIRNEVIDYFRFPAARVVAIPLAAAKHFAPQEHVETSPYVLYLGTLEARKNLEVVVEAARELWREGLNFTLRLAGQCRAGYVPPTHPSIEWMGPQDEGVLPGLLSGAATVVYPSLYEGFGLPVLEAMQCGAMVIASRIPVLMEVGGEAATYAGASDVKEWVEALRVGLTNPQVRKRQGDAGIERAKEYSWQKTARRMHELYERCL